MSACSFPTSFIGVRGDIDDVGWRRRFRCVQSNNLIAALYKALHPQNGSLPGSSIWKASFIVSTGQDMDVSDIDFPL